MPIADVEKAVIEVAMRENLVEVVAVGVGDEYLSKLLAGHQLDDMLHPMRVELVKNVVEQQQWLFAVGAVLAQ